MTDTDDATHTSRTRLQTIGDESIRGISGRLPATPPSVAEARHAITRFAREHGAGEQASDDIALAVSEAASNVVLHAYDADCRGTLRYLADVEDGDLQVLVSDDGDGLGDDHRNPGLGVGLQLVAQLTTDFAITARSPSGLDVWMRFLLSED